jgi:SAM-dependent methyltransferase
MVSDALIEKYGSPTEIQQTSDAVYDDAYDANADTWTHAPLSKIDCTFARKVLTHARGDWGIPLIFDAGCGRGVKSQEFARKGLYVVGIDQSKKAIGFANALRASTDAQFAQRLRFHQGRLEHMLDVVERPEGSFYGGVDIQALSSIVPELQPAVIDQYARAITPGGHMKVEYITTDEKGEVDFHNAEALPGNFYKDLVFEPSEGSDKSQQVKKGMYIIAVPRFDLHPGLYGMDPMTKYFEPIDEEHYLHPNGRRHLLGVLYRRRTPNLNEI